MIQQWYINRKVYTTFHYYIIENKLTSFKYICSNSVSRLTRSAYTARLIALTQIPDYSSYWLLTASRYKKRKLNEIL